MTFEEFKQHFEIFAKIDSPKMLEICMQEYQTHIFREEGAGFFEPLEDKFRDPSIYTKNLHSILKFDQIKDDQILFLVQPSFEAESLLIIDRLVGKYSLTHIALTYSYWLKYNVENAIIDGDTVCTKSYLSESVGDKVFFLLERSLQNARKPKVQFMVLDGVRYKLSKIVDGCRLDVFKHSPDQESITGKIIQLMMLIIEFTKSDSAWKPDSKESILSILSTIESS